MCGQEYVWLRICLDRPTYRQSKISRDETKGLLNMADIFCFQLHIKLLCLSHFWQFWQTDQTTKKDNHRSSSLELKMFLEKRFSMSKSQLFCVSSSSTFSFSSYFHSSFSTSSLYTFSSIGIPNICKRIISHKICFWNFFDIFLQTDRSRMVGIEVTTLELK